jgi:DNA-binding transcriptional regulator YiaG
MPLNPTTLGEHIRKRRLELKLFQKDVAAIFNVSDDCVTYWENNRSEPQIQYYPLIFGFLEYCPFELDTSTLMGRIKAYRYVNGLSQNRLARMVGVDPSTILAWENEKGRVSERLKVLLASYEFIINHKEMETIE